ncbi:MAG TPA: hypothetical protein PKE32_02305 [Miltoncostaeaceae bacterium]|nr:hypothetical protein [Miltoncostaeaceae bacterium]
MDAPSTPTGGAAPPRHIGARIRPAWERLAAPTRDPQPFTPALVEGLPARVVRWLRRVITPGSRLLTGARIRMHGRINIGRWRPFSADQIIGPDGFIWAARAGRAPLSIRGYDRFTDGRGEMRWRLAGIIPVMSAAGDDITRSAAGRLAAEMLVITPAAALSPAVRWSEVDARTARATVTLGPYRHEITLEIARSGQARHLSLPRWGSPDGGPPGEHPFEVSFTDELEVHGQRLPGAFQAAWRHADGGEPIEFFRATIDRATLF